MSTVSVFQADGNGPQVFQPVALILGCGVHQQSLPQYRSCPSALMAYREPKMAGMTQDI